MELREWSIYILWWWWRIRTHSRESTVYHRLLCSYFGLFSAFPLLKKKRKKYSNKTELVFHHVWWCFFLFIVPHILGHKLCVFVCIYNRTARYPLSPIHLTLSFQCKLLFFYHESAYSNRQQQQWFSIKFNWNSEVVKPNGDLSPCHCEWLAKINAHEAEPIPWGHLQFHFFFIH